MKAVCVISGGMDSSTAAFIAKEQGYEIWLCILITINER